MKKPILYLLLCLISLSFLFFTQTSQTPTDVEWPEYLGGTDRNHYSNLTQINKENVAQLTSIESRLNMEKANQRCKGKSE